LSILLSNPIFWLAITILVLSVSEKLYTKYSSYLIGEPSASKSGTSLASALQIKVSPLVAAWVTLFLVYAAVVGAYSKLPTMAEFGEKIAYTGKIFDHNFDLALSHPGSSPVDVAFIGGSAVRQSLDAPDMISEKLSQVYGHRPVSSVLSSPNQTFVESFALLTTLDIKPGGIVFVHTSVLRPLKFDDPADRLCNSNILFMDLLTSDVRRYLNIGDGFECGSTFKKTLDYMEVRLEVPALQSYIRHNENNPEFVTQKEKPVEIPDAYVAKTYDFYAPMHNVRIIEKMNDYALSHGIKLILLEYPSDLEFMRSVYPKDFYEKAVKAKQLFRTKLQERGIDYVMIDHEQFSPSYFYDSVHMNKFGREIFIDQIKGLVASYAGEESD
jgi:hypothetical protein